MGKKYSIFIGCDEATHCCDKSQYDEASLVEKIKLTIHTMYCEACRNYSSNNRKLTKLMKNNDMAAMDSSEKTELEKAFEKELSK